MHKSVPKIDSPCEFINITPLNPLISKCQIKVCYVDDKPNRNRSVITKAVATEMANSLPGSPIVGYFNQEENDFEEHSRDIAYDKESGTIKFVDITRPYGYIDSTAKVWFQWFVDDDSVEREYLMTEGFLWTGQYPEAQRILEHGNNQSMELDDKKINAEWTKDDNGKPQFFIINEAIISKLCILGEKYEPCFEGASITKVQFSLSEDFSNQMKDFVKEMKEILSKGGAQQVENTNTEFELNEEVEVTESAEELQVTPEVEVDVDYKKKDEDEDKEEKAENEEKSEEGKEESSDSKEESKDETEEEDDKKKKKYSLDEIVEYVELKEKYDALEVQYNDLLAEVSELREFKLAADRKDKQEMIEKFCVLSDEDKKDVVENIDKYTLEEIEAKLSVIYVRNGLSFEQEEKTEEPCVYNLDSQDVEDIPAWVKAVMETEKTLN